MAADSLSNSPKLKWNKDYFKDGKVYVSLQTFTLILAKHVLLGW